MRNSIILLLLLATCLCSCGQKSSSTTATSAMDSERAESSKNDENQLSQIHNLDEFIHTDSLYLISPGKGIRIQNSFPRGGFIEPGGKVGYTDSKGNNYAFGIFWTRIVNETTRAIEFNMNFPADSFAIFSQADSYLKLFLAGDKMTSDKVSMFNYGMTGVQSFLDTNFNKATSLRRKINPSEEYLFYIISLFNLPDNGPVRTGLVLKEEDLHYRISIKPYGSELIPCGKISPVLVNTN